MIGMFMALLCCGCTDKVGVLGTSDSEPSKLVVTLRVDEDALKGGSRAQGNYGATTEETKINSLTLFYTQVNKDVETVEGYNTVMQPDLSQLLKFELPATKGTKRFYLAANISQAQIEAFVGDKSVYSLPKSDLLHSYSNANQLMDIDASTGKGSNVLMTARITQFLQQDILVTSGEIHIDTPVKLERVVSKVLLTCATTTHEGSDYVVLNEDIGWTKLNDVRYMGNMFSRKLYLFPQVDPEDDVTPGSLMDANYAMSDLIMRDETTGNYIVRPDKYEEYMDNFQFYDLYEQIDMLKAVSDKPYHEAVKYDRDRLDVSSDNLYTEGMYFPENRVKKDMEILAMGPYSPEESVEMTSRLLTTHLLVTARFVPKTVVIDDKGALKEITVATEEEMLSNYLIESKEVLAGENKTYQQGTFWYYDKKFYTLEGMKLFLKLEGVNEATHITRADMERYDGGWGYYYTFIDGIANNGVIDHLNQKSWGLSRNHYYILNVKKLIPPGASVPGNKLMKIPIEQLEWIDKGGSDITVIP